MTLQGSDQWIHCYFEIKAYPLVGNVVMSSQCYMGQAIEEPKCQEASIRNILRTDAMSRVA